MVNLSGPGQDDETWRALLDRPTRSVPWPSRATSAIQFSGPCILVGWSIRESSGGAGGATVHLHQGQSASNELIYAVQLANNTDDHAEWGEGGVYCPAGVYVEAVAGTTTGALHLKY